MKRGRRAYVEADGNMGGTHASDVLDIQPGGVGAIIPRITRHQAVITRDYPSWTATVTGGDITEPGHVISSLSYARLCDEVQDWLDMHYDHLPEHRPAPGDNELADEDNDDLGAGEGFEIRNDWRFPEPVAAAQDRYRAARKAQAQARHEISRAVFDIHEGLRAGDEDVAELLHMSPKRVQQIIIQRDREEAEKMRPAPAEPR
jgi:hypothetical protein